MLVNKQCVLVLATDFTAKRVRTSEWKARRKGGFGGKKALVKAKKGKEGKDGDEDGEDKEDAEEESPEALAGVFCCHDFDALLVFSEQGFVYILQALDVPLVKKSFSKGTALKTFLPELEDQRVSALVTVPQGRLRDQEDFVVLVSKKGFAKKVSLSRFSALRPGKGMQAMKLADGDQLGWAHKAGANCALVLATAEGYVLRVSLGQDWAMSTPKGSEGHLTFFEDGQLWTQHLAGLAATGPEVSAEIWDALGVALLAQGRPKQAEEAFRRALTTTTATEAKAANDSFDAEWAANNLAVALKAQGSESPETLTSLNNLAVLLKAEGNLHPDTLTSINNLATLLSSTGRTTEAENLYQEALEGCQKTLGEDDLDDGFVPGLFVRIRIESEGRPAEAEVYFRRAQQGLSRQLGVFDPESLRSKDNLAVTLMALQRLDEAEPLLKEAVEGFRQVLGEDHPDTLVAQANLFALMEEIEERDADTLSRTAPGKCVMKIRKDAKDNIASCSISELTPAELEKIQEKAAAKAASSSAAMEVEGEDAEASNPKAENEESDKEVVAEESEEEKVDDKEEEVEKVEAVNPETEAQLFSFSRRYVDVSEQ
eukprot:symbB.v1.2.009263.t2/scaffold566.1/size186494/4